MNFLALILGGALVKQWTDYPQEIRNLRDQLPSSDRDAVIQHYKTLPNEAKTDFKKALRNADLNAASQILGEDLSKYNIVLKSKDSSPTATETAQAAGTAESDFSTRINKILAEPMTVDPALVAEAAKRYEAAVPAGSDMNINEKVKRLLEISA